ncbi:DMT family transporter [Zafaria sp. Z1313]|uniref:DMT family transporter n=1 Tax=unclassified Zafaria TaxID=2828765 RepID=UPI002E78DF34|nr:DMT family transporter [Zafaria sp. J156]MEE1621488.1 DMT family transporter [Zafaria sp. J156]
MIFLLAAIGVLGVGASGPLIAATPSVPPMAMAFWRNAIGGVVMAAPVLVRRPASLLRAGRREWGWSAAAALALALHFVCFTTSIRMTSVAAATALVCLQSAWIALFQVLRGVRFPPLVGIGIGVAFIGVVVITGFDLGGSAEALRGDLLALVGGALAGAYTLAGSKARETMSTGAYTGLCYVLTALILLALCLVFDEPLWGFPPEGWLGIIALTVCAQLLGHSVFNHLLNALGPLTVSTIILLEIPAAALLAAGFLGERLPAGTYGGLVLILAGLVAVVRGQRRRGPGVVLAEPGLGAD